MPLTKADLIQEVLEDLVATGAGQAASAEDTAAVERRLRSIVADLKARRIVAAIDLAAISDAVFPDLVRLAVEHVAPKLGREPDADAIAAAESRLAQSYRLERTASTPLVRRVLEQVALLGAASPVLDATAISERIPEILADLSEREIYYLPDEDDVPSSVMPHLVRHIAASLASPPLYPVMTAAEDALRELRGRRRLRALRVDRALLGKRC